RLAEAKGVGAEAPAQEGGERPGPGADPPAAQTGVRGPGQRLAARRPGGVRPAGAAAVATPRTGLLPVRHDRGHVGGACRRPARPRRATLDPDEPQCLVRPLDQRVLTPPESRARMMRRDGRLRVVHLVTSLNVGGLEMFVLHLARFCDRAAIEPSVLCLDEAGELAPRFEAIGVPVETVT